MNGKPLLIGASFAAMIILAPGAVFAHGERHGDRLDAGHAHRFHDGHR
ncbi:MAG: hypothetical protein U9R74_10855 [Pseudomonadota bacterium]|nr:hypothetical protein [Pseudomonadota bacterium]